MSPSGSPICVSHRLAAIPKHLLTQQVAEFLPVTVEDNQCLDCHDVPKYIDKPKNMDRTRKSKSPMPEEHYASSDLEDVSGARFNCTQCHVPQSNAAPLVESTYR